MLEFILLLVIFIPVQFPLLKNYEHLGGFFGSKKCLRAIKIIRGQAYGFENEHQYLDCQITNEKG